ncbi:MAG: hypothetical protein WAU81_05880, partial [Candidatus Aminicenantales bacterium]
MLADELVALLGLFPEVEALPAQRILVEGVSDAEEDPVPVKRLFQEFESPELGGFHGRLNGALPRDHDHFGGIGTLPDFGQDIQAVPAGHLDVEKDELEVDRIFDQRKGLLAVDGFEELISFVLEDHLEGFPDILLVIDDQDFGFALVFHVRLLRGILAQPGGRRQPRSVLVSTSRLGESIGRRKPPLAPAPRGTS